MWVMSKNILTLQIFITPFKHHADSGSRTHAFSLEVPQATAEWHTHTAHIPLLGEKQAGAIAW